MDITSYINDYLTKRYIVRAKDVKWFKIIHKYNNTEQSLEEWISTLIQIFDIPECRSIAMKWYNVAMNDATIELDVFFMFCRLELGPLSWSLYHQDMGLVTSQKFMEEFKGIYSQEFLHAFWTVKLTNLSQIATHRAMGLPPP